MSRFVYFVIMLLSLSSFSGAGLRGLDSISSVLKHVETNHNPALVGDGGRAFGILQIHKGAIMDVNRRYGTYYTHQDAFDVVCSEEIFRLYIGLGIEIYQRKNNCQYPSVEQIVRMWNGGIYRGHIKSSTIRYYKKYLKYKNGA